MAHSSDRDRLFELIQQISSYEGIRSVQVIHNLLLEAADFCSQKFSLDVMGEVNAMVRHNSLPSQSKSDCVRSIYVSLGNNVRSGYEDPSAQESVRRTIAYGLREGLNMSGLDDSEILQIFSASLRRSPPALPAIYRDNPFVQVGHLEKPTQ